MVKGITKYGWGTSPTLPHREIAPDDKRSTIVSEMKCAKGLHEMALGKIRQGGKALYCSLKGWKNSRTSIQSWIQRKMFGVGLKGAIFAMLSHAGKQAWMLPATKVSGSLRVSIESSARLWPLITSRKNWGEMWRFSTAIPWATSRGEPSNRTKRIDGLTFVGLKSAVNSYVGVAGETPLKHLKGG